MALTSHLASLSTLCYIGPLILQILSINQYHRETTAHLNLIHLIQLVKQSYQAITALTKVTKFKFYLSNHYLVPEAASFKFSIPFFRLHLSPTLL